ncbi:hypothetical protein ACA910_009052 [Epithemia clementina (nom. ined.)]
MATTATNRRNYSNTNLAEDDSQQTDCEQQLTADCLEIVQNAIAVVNPEAAIRTHCRLRCQTSLQIGTNGGVTYDLTEFDQILVVAFGKASSGMATSLVQILVSNETTTNHAGNGNQNNNNDNDNDDNNRLYSTIAHKLSGLVIVKDDHATQAQVDYLTQYNISVREASHPIPDERSVEATRELLQLVHQQATTTTADDNHHPPKRLILVCISGGGSALLCAPYAPHISLSDLRQTNTILLQSGLSIQEMNVIRKKLEVVKGGGLLAATGLGDDHNKIDNSDDDSTATSNHCPQPVVQMVSLVLSDVLGDPLDLIASGPTVRDTSTWQEAWDLVQQKLPQKGAELPEAVLHWLKNGKDKEAEDQEKKPPQSVGEGHGRHNKQSQEPEQRRHQICLVGNNALAVESAAQTAQRLGYHSIVLGTQFQGQAQDMAQFLVAMAQHIQQGPSILQKYSLGGGSTSATGETSTWPWKEQQQPQQQKRPRIALIAGGETTVTIPSDCQGKGGRNQELALTAALAMGPQRVASGLPRLRNIVMASVGTDGTDGPTDAAGAVVDGSTTLRLPGQAVVALQQHDAYHYLAQTYYNNNNNHDQKANRSLAALSSPLIRTGPTGTNVADVMVVLIDPN